MWRIATALTLLFIGCRHVSPIDSGPVLYEPIRVFNPGTSPQQMRKSALKVMTINLAHGRSTGFHQAFQSTEKIERQLQETAHVIRREKPDVVALQEADSPSVWSGNFSHVTQLLSDTDFHIGVAGTHAKGMGLEYGTALLANSHVTDTRSQTFLPAPVRPPKGFTSIRVEHPAFSTGIQIISVHLDFLSAKQRIKQANQIIVALKENNTPLIIMGDFNCEWKQGDALTYLAEKLNLNANLPPQEAPATFPKTGRTLDWIITSQELKITEYTILKDKISDHLAVTAVIIPAQDEPFQRYNGEQRVLEKE